jgi:hypothetical protein
MSDPIALAARTIVVERLEVARTGFSAKTRKPYTLYEVHATDAQTGERLTGLRTFRALPVGPIEVTLEPYNGSGTFTIAPTGKIAAGAPEPRGDRVTQHADLRTRVSALEAEVADLRARMVLLASLLGHDEPAA